jgi:hypothetical protein
MLKIHFTDFFGLSPDALDEYGAFNVSLINDLPLFVDPFLLFNSERDEYQNLHAEVIRYLRFLREAAQSNSLSPGLVSAWFTFPEVRQNWLGFSKEGNRGHGLGQDFAQSLSRSLVTVFRDFGEERLTSSSHIEKLTLVRNGVGRDNISDFTVNLIKGFLAAYTEKFALQFLDPSQVSKFALKKSQFSYQTHSWITRSYTLPNFREDFVLLTPRDILTKDEAWINRSDLIDQFQDIAISLPDGPLRAQVNEYLLRELPKGSSAKPNDIREVIRSAAELFPGILDYYVKNKEELADQASSVAQGRVAEVQAIFVEQIRDLVSRYLEPAGFYLSSGNTYIEARQRLLFLKDVIENKGGHRFFYLKDKYIARESDLQLLFRLTWFATPSDISREVNDGRGPVDFKASRGAKDKTLVEFKLASNSQLERNLEKQTPIYEKASDPSHLTLKAILYFTKEQLARVNRILENLKLTHADHVVLIDARADNKPSGSRA